MWWVELLNSFAAILDSGGAGGAGGAFESIATATGTGSSGEITFSSIPSTYKHLQIRGIARSSQASHITLMRMRLNGDTGANYAQHTLYGDGSVAGVDTNTSDTEIQWVAPIPGTSATSNIVGAFIIDLHDYASTTKNKTVRAFSGDDGNLANTDYRVFLKSGLWMSTSAINSVTLRLSGVNFTTQTSISLYGIKGA